MTDVETLLAALDHPAKLARRQAAEALGEAGSRDPAVRARLEAELGSGALARRWTVAYALFLAGERSARLWPVLLDAMGSDDGDLRWAASRLVVALEVPDLTARLLGAVASGPPEQRKMALYCLRERGERSGEIDRAVAGSLAGDDVGVRLAAMSALAAVAVDTGAAAAALIDRLTDGDAGVRRAAAAALGRLGLASSVVLRALEQAAGADDDALGRAARGALGRLR